MEIEDGEKLDILFDAFKMHDENFENQNQRINRCEIKIEKNSDDIYILNSKVNSR